MEIMRELCSFEGRLAGTDAERRAANRLAERLRELGRRVEVEPTYVHPQSALVHAAPLPARLRRQPRRGRRSRRSASRSSCSPRPRCTSTSTAASTCCAACSSAAPRRTSSPAARSADAPAAPAHLRPRRRRPHRRRLRPSGARGASPASRRARRSPLGPVPDPLLVARAAAPAARPADGRRRLGAGLGPPAPPHPRPADRRSSRSSTSSSPTSSPAPTTTPPASPTALSLADELDAEPPANLDVWVVLNGGEECTAGGHALVRALAPQASSTERPRSSSPSTRSAAARCASRPAPAGSSAIDMDRRLIELCEAIADADAEADERYGPPGFASGLGGDDDAARGRPGFRALGTHLPRRRRLRRRTATCPPTRPSRSTSAPLDRAHDFALELIRRLDADLGRGAVIEVGR